VDNDGDALITGALYWNTTVNSLFIWTGSVWSAAVFDTNGALFGVNNLSDVTDAATARTNLGLGNVDNTADSVKNVASAAALATPRTIALSGDVSGSVAFDGSANVTITAAVADDSHNHVIGNVDGLQAALDDKASISYVDTSVANLVDTAPATLDTLNELAAALGDDPNFATTVSNQIGTKLDASANAVSASKWQTARTITLSGDISGSVSLDGSSNVTLSAQVSDDSHNHVISNVDGLQTALDGKAAASHTHTASNITDFTEAVQDLIGADVVAGTGIAVSYNDTTGDTTITNTAPDQTVSLTGSGATSVSGTYPNFTISSTDNNTTYSAGGGLSLSGTTFSHTDTSSQASVDNSGATVIQDVTLDTYGHVTALGSTTLTAATVGALAVGAKAADSNLLDGYDYTDFNGVVARWITTSANATGRLKLKLPFATNSGLMLKFTISQYTSYTQYDYEVAAYLYPSTDQWYIPTAVFTGTGSPDIVVGREADGKAYVSIADGMYTGVIVHSLTIGYIGTEPNAYDQGWVITQDATTPNSVSVDVRTTWNSGNDGAGSGLDADLLDGQQGAYYYPASNPSGYTTNTGTVTSVNLTAGGAITVSGGPVTSSGSITVNHADTSSQASVDNSGATVIQDVTLDTYGHVTGLGSATLTAASVGAPSTDGTGASGTWGINVTGNSATTSQRNFSGDISTAGQGRFTGWYSGGAATGTAAEIGMSGGQGYMLVYNRDTSTYGTLNIAAAAANMEFSGGTINVNQGALQQGGNQVLHAGNVSSYALPLSGGTLTGDVSISSYAPRLYFTDTDGHNFSLYNNSNFFYLLNGSGSGLLYSDTSGNFTANGNVTAYSDARLKTDLEVITGALDKVKTLTGYTYTRIDSGERQTGVVAQDVQKVLPEAVNDSGEHMTVAYGNMVGLLIEAIKEQQAQIEDLKARLEV
jgi:hypothetical protein